ncbi:MAG: hypothetical protein MJ252_14225 [archaeon]|nr:hypothetical protein [archaeon]
MEESNKNKTNYTGKATNKAEPSKKPAIDLNEETDYFYSLNFQNAVWSKSSFGGDLPTCRYGHSATIFKHNVK